MRFRTVVFIAAAAAAVLIPASLAAGAGTAQPHYQPSNREVSHRYLAVLPRGISTRSSAYLLAHPAVNLT